MQNLDMQNLDMRAQTPRRADVRDVASDENQF